MTHFQPHRPEKKISMQGRRQSSYCRAVSSTKGRQGQCTAGRSVQGRQLDAAPSARCRAVIATQDRQLNAGPSSIQCRAVVSIEGRSLNTVPVNSTQGRQLSAAPSAQCSAVSSMQEPSVSMQGRLFQIRGRLCQCRAVCLLNTESAQCRASPQCSAVPSAQRRARLLNATPFCSTQGRPLDAERSRGRHLKAGPSVQSKAVRFNAGPWVPCFSRLPTKKTLAGSTFLFPNSCQKKKPGDTLLIPDFG